jgi:2'-5' RNA ligase
MIAERPTREEILAAVPRSTLAWPPGIPQALIDEANQANDDYIVDWTLGVYDHVKAYEANHQKAAGVDDLEKSHSFGCVMVDVDPASDVGALMSQMRAEIDPADLAGSGLEPESHITVRYGILPDADLNGLRLYLKSLDPFTITFGSTSTFPPSPSSDAAAVVKVDIISGTLEEINAAMAQHAAFKPADFEYHAHATLAYVDPAIAWKYIADDRLEGRTMLVHTIAIRGVDGPAELVQLLGAHAPWKQALAKKLAKRAEEPAVSQARSELQAAVSHFFTSTASEIGAHVRQQAEKLAKASLPETLLRGIPKIRWKNLVPIVSKPLNVIARTGAGKALAYLEIPDKQMLSDVNRVAGDWADQRAAELVGMRLLPDGTLIENPNAEWNISDRTRDDLRQIIEDAFE